MATIGCEHNREYPPIGDHRHTGRHSFSSAHNTSRSHEARKNLAALAQLLSSLSHDVRTPLGILYNDLTFLTAQSPIESPSTDQIEVIRKIFDSVLTPWCEPLTYAQYSLAEILPRRVDASFIQPHTLDWSGHGDAKKLRSMFLQIESLLNPLSPNRFIRISGSGEAVVSYCASISTPLSSTSSLSDLAKELRASGPRVWHLMDLFMAASEISLSVSSSERIVQLLFTLPQSTQSVSCR